MKKVSRLENSERRKIDCVCVYVCLFVTFIKEKDERRKRAGDADGTLSQLNYQKEQEPTARMTTLTRTNKQTHT